MEEAGLTAGAFYAHFDSKEALLAEAVTVRGGRGDGEDRVRARGAFGEGLDRSLSCAIPQSAACAACRGMAALSSP